MATRYTSDLADVSKMEPQDHGTLKRVVRATSTTATRPDSPSRYSGTGSSTRANNEPSEIIRIFKTAFNGILPADKAGLDLYTETHRAEIDALDDWVYLFRHQQWMAFTRGLRDAAGYVVKLLEGLDTVERILTGKD
ncbi:hypothetical protein B0H15DRAFT_795171 [Mycena belliarum]|uniref:Uncharacterized protein n=1 Tax=Mycena belliarum TaxID=1033014 RepID=A0AAD6UJU4_9AGAR|nr:hypothetical protein B0H15DRAFT_795171 [Mycena belliae]